MNRALQRVVLLLIPVFMLSLPLAGHAQQDDSALLKVRETVWRAWFAGDTTLLKQLVPADTIVISASDKEWKNQADVLSEAKQFRSSGAKLARLDFPKTRIQHFGDVAIIWSDYVLEIESDGKRSESSGRATEVFVWRNGGWVNPGWHTDSKK